MSSSPTPRPIVCGLDNSYMARPTVVTAANVAARLGTPVVLMYIADPSDPLTRRARTLGEARDHAAGAVDRLVSPILSERGLEAEVEVEIGEPSAALVETADRRDAQFLVIGSRGSGRGGGLLGNVSRRLVRQAPCPVIVVPRGAAAKPVTHPSLTRETRPVIVCGLDHDDRDQTLLFAIDLAVRMQARLVFLHVYGAPVPPLPGVAAGEAAFEATLEAGRERGKSLLEDAAGAAGDGGVPAVETRLTAGDPAHEMRAAAEAEKADLILVGNRGRGWLRSMLLGSVSSDLVSDASTPVAVLPASARIAPRSGHYEVLLQAGADAVVAP